LCQKRTGGAFSMSLVAPSGALEITAGEPQAAERVRADGAVSTAWTCPACFSRIHSRVDGAPVILLRAGTLDDTSQIRPVAQIWTSSAQRWAIVADILSYEEQPTDFGPILAAWQGAVQKD
jgi:hypothetical protein